MVNPGDRLLSFTLTGNSLRGNASGPSDAFEVALLNANTGAAVCNTVALTRSDALLNWQTDGTERLAPGVRKVAHADGSATYYLNLQEALAGNPSGVPVYQSFDLLGFGATDSSVTLRDVRLISDPVANADTATFDEDSTATASRVAAPISPTSPAQRNLLRCVRASASLVALPTGFLAGAALAVVFTWADAVFLLPPARATALSGLFGTHTNTVLPLPNLPLAATLFHCATCAGLTR
jgi:hypothetical protein